MGIFFYTPQRPGKGVKKDGPKLRRPFLFFSLLFENIWNFIKMNFLFFITALPIVTLGPAICGLTYYSRCVTDDLHVFLLSDYLEYFKKNFFKGIIASVINIVPLLSLIMIFTNMNTVPHFKMFILPVLLVNLIIIMMSFYVYPMLITYDIPLWAVYKNAFIFTMAKLPINLVIAAIFIGIIVLCFGFYLIIGFIAAAIILFSLLNFITVFALWPTIKKHMEE